MTTHNMDDPLRLAIRALLRKQASVSAEAARVAAGLEGLAVADPEVYQQEAAAATSAGTAERAQGGTQHDGSPTAKSLRAAIELCLDAEPDRWWTVEELAAELHSRDVVADPDQARGAIRAALARLVQSRGWERGNLNGRTARFRARPTASADAPATDPSGGQGPESASEGFTSADESKKPAALATESGVSDDLAGA